MCDPIVEIKHNYLTIQDHWSVVKNMYITLTEQIDSEVSGFVRVTILSAQFTMTVEIGTNSKPSPDGGWTDEATWNWSLCNNGHEIQHDMGSYDRMITNERISDLLAEINADTLSEGNMTINENAAIEGYWAGIQEDIDLAITKAQEECNVCDDGPIDEHCDGCANYLLLS